MQNAISKRFRRKLRCGQTDAEQKLWSYLRSRRLAGFKFSRQYSIGKYIVDFCCREERLIVELDGFHHLFQKEYDRERTRYLESMGYRVLRFWDDDVLRRNSLVLRTILNALGT